MQRIKQKFEDNGRLMRNNIIIRFEDIHMNGLSHPFNYLNSYKSQKNVSIINKNEKALYNFYNDLIVLGNF